MSKPIKHPWPKATNLQSWEKLRHDMEGRGHDYVRIGASDVAAAIRASTYKCPSRLFHHLIGNHNFFRISESTAAGHALEPIIADRFMAYDPDDEEGSLWNWQNGTKLRKIKKADFFVTNPEFPWLFASLDYVPVGKVFSPFTGEKYAPLTPIENKTTTWGFYKEWENGITYPYLLQIQQQMLLTNTKVAVFNVLIDGTRYKVMEVERDDMLCERIVQETKKFADIVKVGKMAWEGMQAAKDEKEYQDFETILQSVEPDPIGIPDDVTLQRELSPIDNDLSIPATEEDESLMREYVEAGEIIKQMESIKNKTLAELLRRLGDFQKLEGQEFKLIYKRGENRRDYTRVERIKLK